MVEAKVAALTATLNEMKEKKASLERDIEDTKNKVSLHTHKTAYITPLSKQPINTSKRVPLLHL